MREEEIARQFGEALRNIKIDTKIMKWILTALKDSHDKEKLYHNEALAKLQKQHEKLQARIDAMYEDKLDGEITQRFYDHKSNIWRGEQEDILRKIEKHQNANQTYMDEGVRLLELAQHDVKLYEKQEMTEKRRILDLVGCIIGGAKCDGSEGLADIVGNWGGREESSILGYGYKGPAHNAAMVNAIFAA